MKEFLETVLGSSGVPLTLSHNGINCSEVLASKHTSTLFNEQRYRYGVDCIFIWGLPRLNSEAISDLIRVALRDPCAEVRASTRADSTGKKKANHYKALSAYVHTTQPTMIFHPDFPYCGKLMSTGEPNHAGYIATVTMHNRISENITRMMVRMIYGIPMKANTMFESVRNYVHTHGIMHNTTTISMHTTTDISRNADGSTNNHMAAIHVEISTPY